MELNLRSFCINAGLQGRVGKDVEEEESEKEMYKRWVGGVGGCSGPLMVSVVKGLTSALLTKEGVLALNTFFLHELLKITQRLGCTLFCCCGEEPPSTAPCPVDGGIPTGS